MAATRDGTAAEKIATAHVEERLGHGALEDAKLASDLEHTATIRESLKKHKWFVATAKTTSRRERLTCWPGLSCGP